MNDRQTYFPGLDGLRAVSVCLVLLHHIGMIFAWWPFRDGPRQMSVVFFRLMQIGFIGVDVFFVISGFLIAGLLLEDVAGPLRLKRFYIRRLFKILPQYLAVLIVGLLLSFFVFHEIHSGKTCLGYLLFFQNYGGQIDVLRHLWTMAVEGHFYILLPLIFGCVWAIDQAPKKRVAALTAVCVALLVVANGLRWFDFHHLGLSPINQPPEWQWTHRRFDALVFGCLLRLGLPTMRGLTEKSRMFPWLLFITGIFGVGIPFQGEFTHWMDYSILYVSCGLLMAAVVLGVGWLTRWLETPSIRFIGRNSYGLYMWHMTTIFSFRGLYRNTDSAWAIAGYVMVTFLLGILTTATLEKGFIGLRKEIVP